MKKSLQISLISVFIFNSSNAQIEPISFSDSCSKINDWAAYFWKIDSLGNNGFRLLSHKMFLTCKINGESVDNITAKFGPPNRISITNKGIDYCYYYYDSKKLPGDFSNYGCNYIYLEFDNNTKKLISTGTSFLHY